MAKRDTGSSTGRTLLVLLAVLVGVIAGLVAGLAVLTLGTKSAAVLAIGGGVFVVVVKFVLYILKELKLL